MKDAKPHPCPICQATSHSLVANINKKPLRETDFGIAPRKYVRTIVQCNKCGSYLNVHRMMEKGLYSGAYTRATYDNRLEETYLRIRSLPNAQSDNKGRVGRVHEFAFSRGLVPEKTYVLDVGSGLCVFPGEMRDLGYNCMCIDPDPASVDHAVNHVGIQGGFAGKVEDYVPRRKFDIITFNKVLEHLDDPVSVLRLAAGWLTRGGFIYVEVPDGENALRNGSAADREEFYIEHNVVFAERSLRYMLDLARYSVLGIRAIHEPSDKYTLCAFAAVTT